MAKKFSIVSGCLLVFFLQLIALVCLTNESMIGSRWVPKYLRVSLARIAVIPREIVGSVGFLFSNFKQKTIDGIPSPNFLKTNRVSGYLIIPYTTAASNEEVKMVDLQSGVEKKMAEINFTHTENPNYTDTLLSSIPNQEIRTKRDYRVWNPALISSNLMVYNTSYSDLVCYDYVLGSEVWRVRGCFHHSVEVDSDDNIWACASRGGKYPFVNADAFEDNLVVKITKNGRIEMELSIAEILKKSNLSHLITGIVDTFPRPDPFHLNQITPVQADGSVLKRGDILLSLRNISTVVLYDPNMSRVKWHLSGPWIRQHCVMQVTNDVISVLDNNVDDNTTIAVYDVKQGRLISRIPDNIKNQGIKIPIEGRGYVINETTGLIEDSRSGVIMVFSGDELIYRWTNYIGQTNKQQNKISMGIISWSRYVSKKPQM